MHENTPYFFIFPFFEIFRGLLPPHGTTPDATHSTFLKTFTSYITNQISRVSIVQNNENYFQKSKIKILLGPMKILTSYHP